MTHLLYTLRIFVMTIFIFIPFASNSFAAVTVYSTHLYPKTEIIQQRTALSFLPIPYFINDLKPLPLRVIKSRAIATLELQALTNQGTIYSEAGIALDLGTDIFYTDRHHKIFHNDSLSENTYFLALVKYSPPLYFTTNTQTMFIDIALEYNTYNHIPSVSLTGNLEIFF